MEILMKTHVPWAASPNKVWKKFSFLMWGIVPPVLRAFYSSSMEFYVCTSLAPVRLLFSKGIVLWHVILWLIHSLMLWLLHGGEGSPTAISEACGDQLETQLGQYYDKTGVSCCTELQVLIALVKLNSFNSFTYWSQLMCLHLLPCKNS